MGLDMYLKKKTFIWTNYENEGKRDLSNIKINDKKYNHIKPERICEITEDIGYWRKANHIHKWFVENVQDGKDDCGEYYVSRENLLSLLDLCRKVKRGTVLIDGAITNGYSFENGVKMPIIEQGKEIKNPEFAASLLPTKDGFFFGNTDYDKYYMQDIDDTIEIIEKLLPELTGSNSADIYYHSSW